MNWKVVILRKKMKFIWRIKFNNKDVIAWTKKKSEYWEKKVLLRTKRHILWLDRVYSVIISRQQTSRDQKRPCAVVCVWYWEETIWGFMFMKRSACQGHFTGSIFDIWHPAVSGLCVIIKMHQSCTHTHKEWGGGALCLCLRLCYTSHLFCHGI